MLTPFGATPPLDSADSSAPLYSGTMSIDPSSSALRYSSRAPMLNLRFTLRPAPSKAWAYISASSSFSGKLAEPIVIVDDEPPDALSVLVGSPPHALRGRTAATTAATAASLVLLGMESDLSVAPPAGAGGQGELCRGLRTVGRNRARVRRPRTPGETTARSAAALSRSSAIASSATRTAPANT